MAQAFDSPLESRPGKEHPPTTPSVPDYDLLRRIGGGAYGEVWLARSKATGALRAAKIVWRRTFEDERPYRREFEGIQRFEQISREHPSQLALFHIGRNDPEGYFYYVMELADDWGERSAGVLEYGGDATNRKPQHPNTPPLHQSISYVPHTLRAELANGRLPATRVLEIGLALTEALGHLHGHGLVHRDVKPSNVIFVNGRPKLADIGLVTDASDQCSIVGTEGYLPPEGPGTPQADIFSLGKVLYEAATGLDRQKFPDLPPDLKEWADCSAVLELNEIVLKACAAASSQRYAGAEKMLSDLQRLGQGGSVRRARQRARTWHLVRRVAVGVAATAGLFSLIVLASRIRQPGVVQHVERRSTNAPANHYFELGKANFDLFQGTNMAQAAGYFEKAVQADTNFAQAYGYLAATYFWGGFEDWNQNWVFLPRAREAALRALKLDVTLAEPHLALGTYHGMREWNWIDAEKEDRQAVDLNPSWFCHLCYAELLRVMGRTDESLKEIYQAGNLNPSSRIINNRLVHYLVCAREFDKALEQIDKIVAMQAVTEKDVIWIRMEIFLALGQTDKAIEAERDGRIADGDPRADAERDAAAKMRAPPAERARLLWLPYLDGAAQRISFPRWAKPQKDSYWLYQQARAYAQLGQADAALTRLEDLLKERDTSLTFNVMGDWTLDPLRREKRFHKILRTMHFE